MEKRYDVFISCKSDDYAKAEPLYHWLVEKGHHPFFAPISLSISTIQGEPVVFGDEIDIALEQADNMILFATKAEHVSKGYVKDEWRTFVEEQRAGRKSGSLVTILDGVNVADLPIRLRSVQSFTPSNYKTGILRFLGSSSRAEDGSVKEKDHKAKEEAERVRLEKERMAKAEAERLTREAAKKKRLEEERREEEERKAKEEAERMRLEKERIAKAEAERLTKEAAEKRLEEERRAEEARLKAEKERKAREQAGAERLAKEVAEKRLEEERRVKEARLKAEEERKAKAQAEAERLAKEATERKRLEEERRIEEARLKDEEEQKARERSEPERKVEEAAEYELKENIEIVVEKTDLKDETIYKRGRVVFRTIWKLILSTVIVGGAVYLIGFLWRFLNFMGLDFDWWGGWETIVLCLILGLSTTLYMYFTGIISVNGSD